MKNIKHILLDESGSTKDIPPGFAKSIIETEKDALNSMIDSLFPDDQPDNLNLRFGLVGYSSAIVHSFGLTSNKKQASSYVNSLDFYSGTYSHWGLEAGYNMLNKKWTGFIYPYLCPPHSSGMACIPQNNTSSAPPAATRSDGKETSESKHLVFITDGYIMGQTAPCEYGVAAHEAYPDIDPETALLGDSCPNYRLFNEICDKIKKSGITVYTINFFSKLDSDIIPMKKCASSDDKYFYAPDTKSLKNILSGIAVQIHKIRITH